MQQKKKATPHSHSRDEAIGQILNNSQALTSIAIGPFREIGLIFQPFIVYRTQPKSLPTPKISASASKPNAKRALELAISNNVLSNILGHAKDIWLQREHLEFFDRSYLASNPQIWAEQNLA